MKKRYDAVVVTGKYTGADGKEKNRYANVGTVLERDDGSLCMKLDMIPAHSFSGWINFYTPKTKIGDEPDESVGVPTPSAITPRVKPGSMLDDDEIPF